MLALVIWLLVEMRRVTDRENGQSGAGRDILWNERCTYVWITIFFALSYIGRFMVDVIVKPQCADDLVGSFSDRMLTMAVWLLEGVSMGTLMIFHWKNFQSGSLFSSKTADEPEFASINNKEFYFFTDHEVETINLAEKSPTVINHGI